jgi:hypothetical protein
MPCIDLAFLLNIVDGGGVYLLNDRLVNYRCHSGSDSLSKVTHLDVAAFNFHCLSAMLRKYRFSFYKMGYVHLRTFNYFDLYHKAWGYGKIGADELSAKVRRLDFKYDRKLYKLPFKIVTNAHKQLSLLLFSERVKDGK